MLGRRANVQTLEPLGLFCDFREIYAFRAGGYCVSLELSLSVRNFVCERGRTMDMLAAKVIVDGKARSIPEQRFHAPRILW